MHVVCRPLMCFKSYKISNLSPISYFWTPMQLAQPIRLLLEYTGTKYEDKFYVCGEGKYYLFN